MKTEILVYGAGGYTGRLISQTARDRDMRLIIASRAAPLESNGSARASSFAVRVFSLDRPADIEACIRTKTHYIDIAGEYPEFQAAFGYNEQARAAGIMLMPGAGFGVVPTDIAAVLAHRLLPDATTLRIEYLTEGGASRGTLKTILKDINKPGIQIRNGASETALPAEHELYKRLGAKKYRLVTNPWRADLISAQFSTRIPTIETYSAFPGFIVNFMKGKSLWFREFLLKRLVNLMPVGPSAKQLKAGKTAVWACVSNARGTEQTVRIEGPEAYIFTAQTVLHIALKIQSGQFKPGFQTPSLYGKELIEGIEKVHISVY